MRLDYFMYMNEAEGTGLVDTRTARINMVVKELVDFAKDGVDVHDMYFQEEVLEKYNLLDITKKEFTYMLNKLDEKLS